MAMVSSQLSAPAPAADDYGYLPRNVWGPAYFLIPILICGSSWLMGGQQIITDAGFVVLTLLCIGGVIVELAQFSRRFGVGGLVLYGGVLVWFCQDYLSHWLGVDTNRAANPFGSEVVAKAACLHAVFIFFATIGLLLPWGRWLVKAMHTVPEPVSENFYLGVLLFLCAVGLSPYLFFTTDVWYVAILKQMTGGYGSGPEFTFASGGASTNTSWVVGIVGQTIQVGFFAGQFAAFYCVLISRKFWQRALGWSIWGFWVLMGVGTGSRGTTIFMAFPAIALIFLKHHAVAATAFRRFSVKAYVMVSVALVGCLVLVQYQGAFRTVSFADRDLEALDVGHVQGNTMFSEGMLGYKLVPDKEDFYYNNFPGETILRPIPQNLFWLVTGPIPRALWRGKPVDPVMLWYNRVYTGMEQNLAEGVVGISRGLVGHFYFPFGIAGVIEGGIFFGWMLGVGERGLQRAEGKPMRMIFSLGFLLFWFRSFRDVNWQQLYPLCIAGALMFIMVKLDAMFNGGRQSG